VWIAVSPSESSRPLILGRGPAQPDDEFPRIRLVLQRPGSNRELPSFENRSLSRRQLLLRAVADDALHVVNVGRCPLMLNGADVTETTVRPGDVLQLGQQLVLLCMTREPKIPGHAPAADHAFGATDACGFVGESPIAWKIRAQIEAAAPQAGHVLVLGATGTGKELAAGALHALSGRTGPLIARNAANIPESLVDAELFGHPKDYPNHGMRDRVGLVGAADGGTLFLDEFADLPVAAQAHLLRVLDAGEYQRLGETTARRSRFRLVAATNRPEHALRDDLLARFDFRIRTPPLTERREDLPFLVRRLFAKIAEEAPDLCRRFTTDDGLPNLSSELVRQLARCPFSGNVRELRALLWASLHASGDAWLEWPADGTSAPVAPESRADAPSIAAVERVLAENGGSIEKSWRALGMSSRHALQRLLRKYGMTNTKHWKKR
jgi:DNA-binding NtrC family response regulator